MELFIPNKVTFPRLHSKWAAETIVKPMLHDNQTELVLYYHKNPRLSWHSRVVPCALCYTHTRESLRSKYDEMSHQCFYFFLSVPRALAAILYFHSLLLIFFNWLISSFPWVFFYCIYFIYLFKFYFIIFF